ncbi:rod shape-determining protein MreD [Porphyromonas levii]|uniref:Rod shape-determining protein MreD n=1 Tax=Porphyromonas levii TaxID=28114 RepID=A0A4Y8WQ97_9PORP|nr:rod shape-determining protein MreD [Porphyromonas levii]MBR8702646.1 hypothetical protein [Porphyromonas levii]MBR8712708.1 hypothetical protein [Porphyromonas levii]MBR8714795.1 hypothetical protein [Porphyromonas levii]MBR8727241.1 hypothetical protein [Porphyromonas levii]MBR8729008.1 hypothetical protein [Porphyromonas levii]
MNKFYFRFIGQSALLLFLQLVVMNNIRLFGLFIPIIYLYPLLFLPYQTPRWLCTVFAAIAGLLMDMMMNTTGINMAAATLVGFIRQPLLFSLTEEQELDDLTAPLRPSIYTLKLGKYVLYMLLLAFIHVASTMLLEAFSAKLFLRMLPHILGSTLITLIIYATFEALSKRNHSA